MICKYTPKLFNNAYTSIEAFLWVEVHSCIMLDQKRIYLEKNRSILEKYSNIMLYTVCSYIRILIGGTSFPPNHILFLWLVDCWILLRFFCIISVLLSTLVPFRVHPRGYRLHVVEPWLVHFHLSSDWLENSLGSWFHVLVLTCIPLFSWGVCPARWIMILVQHGNTRDITTVLS